MERIRQPRSVSKLLGVIHKYSATGRHLAPKENASAEQHRPGRHRLGKVGKGALRCSGFYGNQWVGPGVDPHAKTEVIKNFNFTYKHQDTASVTLKGEKTALTGFNPILSEEKVAKQLGHDGFGSLAAIVELPMKESIIAADLDERMLPLFVFRRDTEAGVRYRIASKRQIEQVHEQFATGGESPTDVISSMVELAPGQQLTIGRSHWLPDVGEHTELLDYDVRLANRYGAVSRNQAMVRVDDTGELHVADLGSRHATKVSAGLVAPEVLHETTGEFAKVR